LKLKKIGEKSQANPHAPFNQGPHAGPPGEACATDPFFFQSMLGVDDMLSTSFKKKKQKTRRLFCPNFSYCGDRKIKANILLI
jgi:hypothetical protein